MKDAIKIIVPSIVAIFLAGLVLKYAGSGVFGSAVKSVADAITSGYGSAQ